MDNATSCRKPISCLTMRSHTREKVRPILNISLYKVKLDDVCCLNGMNTVVRRTRRWERCTVSLRSDGNKAVGSAFKKFRTDEYIPTNYARCTFQYCVRSIEFYDPKRPLAKHVHVETYTCTVVKISSQRPRQHLFRLVGIKPQCLSHWPSSEYFSPVSV
jgi:hypothetical protein